MVGKVDPISESAMRFTSARLPGDSTPRSWRPTSAAVSAHCCLTTDSTGGRVAIPVAEEEGGIVEVGDHRAVGATVGQSRNGARVDQHLVGRPQVTVDVVRNRDVDDSA